MDSKNFSQAMCELDSKCLDETTKRKTSKSAWAKRGVLVTCFCVVVMIAILIIQHNYVTDNEPKKELTVTEAISSEPFGALYPETVLDGYVLENDTVALYDGKVMQAVYCNDSIRDVLTITIATKEYFGDVEQNTILQDKKGGTRIYLESGGYIAAYYFSTRDIANIENFEQMVVSAASFESGLFDEWLQIPSVDPIKTVQSAIEGQAGKEYTIVVQVDEIKIDEEETAHIRARYTGSELAEARGWTDEYLEEHFIVIWAKYYVEYDHTKTFLDDGYTEQYFYLTQDIKTGEWIITDNDSLRTSTTP